MYSIIVPTHNRHDKLKRCLDYYADFGVGIVVVDSSDDAYPDELIGDAVKYYHRPELKFAEKVLFALEVTDSHHLLLTPDDDFILKDSVNASLSRMELNPDIGLGFGGFLFFREGSRKLRHLPVINRNRGVYLKSNDRERLAKRFFGNYDQVLWSLYSRELMKRCFECINAARFSNDNFIELTISTMALYSGKIDMGEEIWGVRERCEGEHWGRRHEPIGRNPADIEEFIEKVGSQTEVGFATTAINAYVDGQKKGAVKFKLLKKLFKLRNITRRRTLLKIANEIFSDES